MADEGDQEAGDGAEQGGEEGADAVGGLHVRLGDAGGHLDVHEQQHEQGGADTGGDDGFGLELKQFFHGKPPYFHYSI